MTSISKNVYIDQLDDVIDIYGNAYYRTIKLKLVYVKSSSYTNLFKEINDEDRKSKIGDIVKTSKYKNNFAKVYVPNWSEEAYCD